MILYQQHKYNKILTSDGKAGRPAPFKPVPSKPVKIETRRAEPNLVTESKISPRPI